MNWWKTCLKLECVALLAVCGLIHIGEYKHAAIWGTLTLIEMAYSLIEYNKEKKNHEH